MRRLILFLLALLILAPSLDAQVRVRGYCRRDGTCVPPHYRSSPNSTTLDNYSTRGNVNPYTGEPGYRDPSAPPPHALDGIGVRIHAANGIVFSGPVLGVTRSYAVIAADGYATPAAIPLDSVRGVEVYTRVGTQWKEGAFAFAVLSAGMGYLSPPVLYGDDCDETTTPYPGVSGQCWASREGTALGYALVGGLFGAFLGSLVEKYEWRVVPVVILRP